jgi:hypothetical protein
LYRGDYAELEKCPNCDASRYKSNADFAVERVIVSKGAKRKVGGKKSVFSQVEEYSIGTDTATQRSPCIGDVVLTGGGLSKAIVLEPKDR